MTIYSVHQPPAPRRMSRRAADPTGPERFAFVRDGFHVWAFLIPLLWMIRHGLWLVLVGYLALSAALVLGLAASGVSATGATIAVLTFAILVGLEAGTLRRWTLRRNRWQELGVVEGHDRDDAERRFFERWTQKKGPALPVAGWQAAGGVMPRFAPAPDIIGLFPQPEGRR